MPEQPGLTALGIAVLTVSDTRDESTDKSGAKLIELLQGSGHRLAARQIVPDDIYRIRASVSAWIADPAVNVVLTTGFTPATSFTLMMQHDAAGDQVFHDGVLCAGGSLIRLRGRAAVAGSMSFPDSNFANDQTLTLSQRGQVVVGSGVRRYYAGWYRNASTTFCPPATANVTNGFLIDW